MPGSSDDRSGLSIERAQQQASQTLRHFSPAVIHELDSESRLYIEINGVPVRQIVCMDSALAELAAGWAFLHRFIESPKDFDRSTVNDQRASVMIQGGIDILHRRSVLNGERVERPPIPEPWPRDDEWSIPDDVLLDILREAWGVFRKDRMSEGSVHAALATQHGIEVVAFDITAENAVAKVLGWCLLANQQPAFQILVVNGPVTKTIVDAASRLGVLIVATPFVPSADAYMASRIGGMNIVGYMRHETVGLFGGPGLVTFDDPGTSET